MSYFSIPRIYFKKPFFCPLTMYLLSFSLNPLKFTIFSRIRYLSIIFLANSLWIYYFSCEFTMTSLYASCTHYEFTIFLTFKCLFLTFSDLKLDVIRRNYDQNLNIYRSICISCIYGHSWHFWLQNDLYWPQNDLFSPFWWPWMTIIFTPLKSVFNFESNHMYIMCIWPCFIFMTSEWYAYHVHLAVFPIFDPKWPFLTP